MVETFINDVCKFLAEATEQTEKGHQTFWKALGGLVGFMIVLRLFSVWTLIYIHVMFQLSWPAVYAAHKEKIDSAFAKAQTKLEPHVAAAKEKLTVVKDKAKAKASELLTAAVEKFSKKKE